MNEPHRVDPATETPTASSGARERRWMPLVGRAREVLLVVVLAFGVYKLASVYGSFEPLGTWLVWRYLVYLALAGVFALSCISAGHAVIKRVVGTTLPIGEHLPASFAVGAVAFYLVVFVAGILGLLAWPTFFVVPLLLLAAGGRDLARWALRVRRHLSRPRPRKPTPPARIAAWIVGGACVALMYLPTLTPSHIGYDCLWYHLPIAEHYVAAGAIRRFPEGWFQGTQPHLASIVYVWAMLLPKSRLFDRMELALHLELTFFLATLASIPPLVRALVPRVRAPASWVALFAFPVLFICDLAAGADHVSAVFAAPAAIFLFRALPALDVRFCALASVMLSGVLLTKFSALPLAVGPVAAIALRATWLLASRLRARSNALAVLRGPGVALAVGLVLTSTWWLKNWVFYHDPVYPMLPRVFHAHPWGVDTSAIDAAWQKINLWAPSHDWAGVKQTLGELYTFSFEVFDWPGAHGNLPIVGSLFTLFALALPFVRASSRLWLLTVVAHVAIFFWYWIHHQERYLETEYPWMAAAAVATAILAWRSGVLARIGVVCLFGLQALWALAVPAFPTRTRFVQPLIELASSTFQKHTEHRFDVASPWREVGEWLPRGSKLLVHESHVHFGIAAMSVSDWIQWQGGIDYGRSGGPVGAYRLLKSMGVTHVLSPSNGQSQVADSIASDLVFFTLATREDVGQATFAWARVGALPPREPEPRDDTVAYLACEASYVPGVYHLKDLALPVYGAPPPASYPKPVQAIPKGAAAAAEQAVLSAEYVVHDPACGFALPPAVGAAFTSIATRHSAHLYARKHAP